MAIIGIDLGTSNSAAAALRGGRPVIIPSAEGVSLGGKAFPSYVAVAADGQMIENPCPDCGGRGEVKKTDSLKISIPVGVENGTALRVAGRGMASPVSGGLPGDLYVVVHVRPDPRFQRDGADLWREETLPLTDAVLGTKLEVPILEGGKAEVDVPAGTQPDTVLRLKNKGLPRFGEKGKGDMYLQVKLKVPDTLSREEKELYERLRAMNSKTKRHFWE